MIDKRAEGRAPRTGRTRRCIGFALAAAALLPPHMLTAQKTQAPPADARSDEEPAHLVELARTATREGRQAEAETLFRRALEAQTQAAGAQSRPALVTASELALVLARQQRFAESEALFVPTIRAMEMQLGPEHAETLVTVNDLGFAYFLQGRFADAIPWFERALAGLGRTSGADHAHTLETARNLATAYEREGRQSEAEALRLRVVDARARTLGETHAGTLSALVELEGHYTRRRAPEQMDAAVRRRLDALTQTLGPDHPQTISLMITRARNLKTGGRMIEAQAAFIRLHELQQRVLGPDHADTLETASELGGVYSELGRYDLAEPLLLQTLQRQEQTVGRESPAVSHTLNELAELYGNQERFAEAEPVRLRALAIAERRDGPDADATLAAIHNLAALYYKQQRFDEAAPLFERNARTQERVSGPDHPATLAALNNLAVFYKDVGRATEATAIEERVVEARQRVLGAEHPETLGSVNNLGFSRFEEGRFAEAADLFGRAYEGGVRTLGPTHPDTLVRANNFVTALLSVPERAGEALAPARLLYQGQRSRSLGGGDDLFAQAQREREALTGASRSSLLADAAWAAATADAAGRAALREEAFAALQVAVSGPANRAIVQSAVRRFAAQAGNDLAGLVRERDTVAAQWSETNRALAVSLGSEAVDPSARQRILDDRQRAADRLAVIDGRLRTSFPDYFALIQPEPVGLAATQGLMRENEALVIVVPTRFGTQIVAVTRDGAEWARADWNSDRVREAVRRLRWDAGASIEISDAERESWVAEAAPGAPGFDRTTAHALYRQLIAPVAGLLEGKTQLYVVAGGSLTGLPFSLLVSEPPQGPDNDPSSLRATRWLADAFALVHIPSVQSIALLRRAAPGGDEPGGGRFAGFGDPVLGGAPAQRARGRGPDGLPDATRLTSSRRTRDGGMIANVSMLRRLTRLPGTARELENMRLAFEAPANAVRLGNLATESAVRSADLSGIDVLAFATHGLTGVELGSLAEPGLVMTPPPQGDEADDGYLAASEVAALRLDADWVILSACNTATGEGSDGLSGLARAFLYAGARSLLASHWPVDDEVAARITVRTVELERDGTPRARAFQQAMREIRMEASRDSPNDSWAHPFYWAPFVLIGEAG